MSSSVALSRLTLGVAATATAASTASGAIVVFDINPDFVGSDVNYTGQFDVGALNFSAGTFSSGFSSFSLFNDYTAVYFFRNAGNVSAARLGGAGRAPLLLSASDPIGAPLDSQFVATVATSFDKSDIPTGTYYLALRRDTGGTVNYGWLEFIATDVPFGGDPTDTQNFLTFTRFAFNDVSGQSILAGQTTAVPEASTLGLVGGLFGLVAAAHLRRRRQRQAAASDTFLALAAGEKLN